MKTKFLIQIRICVIILLTVIPGFTKITVGQLQFVRYDSIVVTESDDTLKHAWAGGFNSPQFSAIDLNGDGLKDLFAFERDVFYGMTKTFINTGVSGKVEYVYDAFYQKAFPPMSNWALLADYNCDGRADIFTNVPFGVAVYRNDFSPEQALHFTKVSLLLQTTTSEGQKPLYVSPADLPAIVDVDNDGDTDILTFDILGKFVEYHQNQSIENGGNCNDLDFELNSQCWGYFSENETNNGIKLYDTCAENSLTSFKSERHAGSALLAFDLSGNGLKDLLIGDIANDNLVGLLNAGTPENASMKAVETDFPPNSLPVDLTTFPSAFYIDVDNDNKKDLLVTPNNPNTSRNSDNILFYRNTGTEDVPEFSFQTNSFLQEEMIDVGAGAKPVFFDYNNDGLLDLVIGNYGYFIESGIYESKLALYQNTGTQNSPAFTLISDDFSDLSKLNLNGVYPAFGDLDGDGKMEMLIGDEDGNLHLFTNTAENNQPAIFVLSRPKYKNIDVGQTSVPQIIDVNKDGKPDILVGERGGKINYFENTGTVTQPDFTAVPTNDFFGGIDVMVECCTGYSAPFLTEDSTGKSVLYVGSEKGTLYLYNNIDENLNGNFNLLDSLLLYGLRLNLAGADINNDGKTELVYGEYAGGVAILKSGVPEFLDVAEKLSKPLEIVLYPNPARSMFTVRCKGIPQGKKLKVEMHNLFGETVLVYELISGVENTVSLSGVKKGIYFVKVTSNELVATKKLVVN